MKKKIIGILICMLLIGTALQTLGSITKNITLNDPPNKPTKPVGPTTGVINEIYIYESYFSDPDGDSLEVFFDWGDGTNTGWIGVVASGSTIGNFHSWTTNGTYQVKTKARDIPNYAESEWSEPLIVTIGEVQSPLADYGDAPDDSNYPGNIFAYPGVVGKFPSLYDTVNADISKRRGPYHITTDQEWLGDITSDTTKEQDASIVDNDFDDCDPMILFLTNGNTPNTQTWGIVSFNMAVSQNNQYDGNYYINVLLDQNEDGEWKNTNPIYLEWIIVNRVINIPEDYKGITFNCMIGPFYIKLPLPEPAWLRITITREPIEIDEWDGSAPEYGFDYGETEDWLIEGNRYVELKNETKDMSVAWLTMSQRIRGNSDCGIHATAPRGPFGLGWLEFSYTNFGTEDLTVEGFRITPCACNKVKWGLNSVDARINGQWTPINAIPSPGGVEIVLPFALRTNDIIKITINVGWSRLPVEPFCDICGCCTDPVHKLYVHPLVDPYQEDYYISYWPGNITVMDPILYYNPIPYSFWEISEDELINIISYDGQESIIVNPSYVTLTEYMGSCNMTWEETKDLNWVPMEETVLNTGDRIEFTIPIESGYIAAFIKYEVRYLEPNFGAQDNFIDRFISEAILNKPWPSSTDLSYTITNLEIKNPMNRSIDSFEIEFYGNIKPSDIIDWHDPEPPGEPYLSNNTWYGGWGCPPLITSISNGIKVTWKDSENLIQPGQSVYFGLFVNPEVSIPTEINGHWNIYSFSPNKPVINGPPTGKKEIEYTYTATSKDVDGDQIYYKFDWGDGTSSYWLGPIDSDAIMSASHTWTEDGDYDIKVKAKDTFHVESVWSDPLSVSMIKVKIYNPMIQLLIRITQRFSLFEKILNQIIL